MAAKPNVREKTEERNGCLHKPLLSYNFLPCCTQHSTPLLEDNATALPSGIEFTFLDAHPLGSKLPESISQSI